MIRFLLIAFLVSLTLSISAQRSPEKDSTRHYYNDTQYFIAAKLGYQQLERGYLETGTFFGICKGLSSFGADKVFGPAASLLIPLYRPARDGEMRVGGVRGGFEYHHWFGWAGKLNAGYYRGGAGSVYTLEPELAYGIEGLISVSWGYIIPLSTPGVPGIGGNRFSLVLNVPVHFFGR